MKFLELWPIPLDRTDVAVVCGPPCLLFFVWTEVGALGSLQPIDFCGPYAMLPQFLEARLLTLSTWKTCLPNVWLLRFCFNISQYISWRPYRDAMMPPPMCSPVGMVLLDIMIIIAKQLIFYFIWPEDHRLHVNSQTLVWTLVVLRLCLQGLFCFQQIKRLVVYFPSCQVKMHWLWR